MVNYNLLRKKYPRYISGEQLRLVCHISKRMARYLLESGLIPYRDGGKPTRKYIVKISDVITYLKDREINPEKYKPPQDWYMSQKARRLSDIERRRNVSQEQLMEYYEMLIDHYPDVLSSKEALTMAGVSEKTLFRWINEKKFRAFQISGKYQIPKISLIGYMVLPEYRMKPNQKHDYIGGFIKWQEQL